MFYNSIQADIVLRSTPITEATIRLC